MQQKALTVVIDEWSAAVHTQRQAREQLAKATSDLLEAFASTATNLSAHTSVVMLSQLEELKATVLPLIAALRADMEAENDRIGVIERRQIRRTEEDQAMQHQIDQLADRTELLEERSLEAREAEA